MLDICHSSCQLLGLSFNSDKSHCIIFGNLYKSNISPMKLGSDSLMWTNQITYLGMKICAGRTMSFDTSAIRQSFFAATNCIYASAKFNDQLVHLSLQETYCKPILTYGIVAIHLTVKQLRNLNSCWNSVYRKIFGFNKWESVSAFISGLGRLDLHNICLLLRAKFYKHLLVVKNGILNELYCIYCETEYKLDSGLSLAQLSYGLITKCVYCNFNRKCNS